MSVESHSNKFGTSIYVFVSLNFMFKVIQFFLPYFTEVFVYEKFGENWALNTDTVRNTILECHKTFDELHRNHLCKPKASHL